MSPQIVLTLTIIVLSVFLFATEKLRPDLISLLVLVTLALTGLVSPNEAFSGFSNPAVITVWAVFIVSEGLFKTGVADYLGERILAIAGPSEPKLILVIMLTCGIMSAFMNNIGATAVLLPAVIGISRQTKVPISRLLIPLSFSSLLGGNMTLIGTPPNILATSILADHGLETFAFFDFTLTGVAVFGTGIVFMVFVGRHLLPVNHHENERQDIYQIRDYISEVYIPVSSSLDGKTLEWSKLQTEYGLTVITIMRNGSPQPILDRKTYIQAEDILTLQGPADELLRAKKRFGFVIESEGGVELDDLDTQENYIIEATLSPRSRFLQRPLREIGLRKLYGFTVLAIWRQGEVLTQRLGQVALRFGDTLLLYGPRNASKSLHENGDFLVLSPLKLELRRKDKSLYSIGIMLSVLLMVMVGGIHISLAMVIGSILMVLSGCLTMDEAYQSISWQSVFLIAGMLPLGLAMDSTGTAQFLADQIIVLVGGLGPLAVLAGIFVLASLLTGFMSNAAATVLVVPIAISTALEIGASPQAFVLGTVIGASTSFLTPVGHQANILVFGPGGYKFLDYTRVGGPMYLLIAAVTLVVLPMVWPLFP